MPAVVLLSMLLSWLVAQLLKVGAAGDWRAFFKSGGMPSSHAAWASALAIAVGLADGFLSTAFAVAFAFGVVVAVDAVQSRRHRVRETAAGVLVGVLGAVAARAALG
jgi:hypothetical protein